MGVRKGGREEHPPLLPQWPASIPELELTHIHPGDKRLGIWEQETHEGLPLLTHPQPRAEPEEDLKPPELRGHPLASSPPLPPGPALERVYRQCPLPEAPPIALCGHLGIGEGSTLQPSWGPRGSAAVGTTNNSCLLVRGQRRMGKGPQTGLRQLRRHLLGRQGWGLPGIS